MYSNNRRDGLVQPSFFIVMTGQIDIGFFSRCYSLGSKVDSQLRSHLREPALYLLSIYHPRTRVSFHARGVHVRGSREMGSNARRMSRGGSYVHQTDRACGAISCRLTTRSSGEQTRYTYLACSIDRFVVAQRGQPWCHNSRNDLRVMLTKSDEWVKKVSRHHSLDLFTRFSFQGLGIYTLSAPSFRNFRLSTNTLK